MYHLMSPNLDRYGPTGPVREFLSIAQFLRERAIFARLVTVQAFQQVCPCQSGPARESESQIHSHFHRMLQMEDSDIRRF